MPFLITFFMVLSLNMISAENTKIYIAQIPIFSSDDNPWAPNRPREQQRAIDIMIEAFKKHDCDLIPTDLSQPLPDAHRIIIFDVPYLYDENYLKLHDPYKCVCLLWEPPTVLPFDYDVRKHDRYCRVYTMIDDFIGYNHYRKYYYPQMCLKMIDPVVPFHEKKLCVQISANKYFPSPFELYTERFNVVKFFETQPTNDFDFYGMHWPNNVFRNYKGIVKTKKDILKNYKFAFCYENSKNINGYISEKIFDCFIAGCVPIFWGAENITHFIPPNCFIDRRNFSSTEDVYRFVQEISESEYNRYLANIKEFLASNAGFKFSLEYFIDTLGKFVIPHYDRRRIFDDRTCEKLIALN
ncbi:hypothetical protein HYX58_05575 [Candidatus Dependentiae bacterium]|nr:hypothetical protein [Candidatus Dependentiae bacterium]